MRVQVYDTIGKDTISGRVTRTANGEEGPTYTVLMKIPFDRYGLDEWGVGLRITTDVGQVALPWDEDEEEEDES